MTPTMEEVAGWLRDRGSELYNKSKRLDNEFGQRDAILKRAECWFDRAAQVEAMGWRPIDEAPRTGEEVDLWDDFAQSRITDCKWRKNAWHRWEPNAFETMDWCRVHGKLTHFMRKPQPPVNK